MDTCHSVHRCSTAGSDCQSSDHPLHLFLVSFPVFFPLFLLLLHLLLLCLQLFLYQLYQWCDVRHRGVVYWESRNICFWCSRLFQWTFSCWTCQLHHFTLVFLSKDQTRLQVKTIKKDFNIQHAGIIKRQEVERILSGLNGF